MCQRMYRNENIGLSESTLQVKDNQKYKNSTGLTGEKFGNVNTEKTALTHGEESGKSSILPKQLLLLHYYDFSAVCENAVECIVKNSVKIQSK